jgi:hypothetical protein
VGEMEPNTPIFWIRQNQNGRRNLDANGKAVLGAQGIQPLTAEAARRQKEEAAEHGVKGGRPTKQATLVKAEGKPLANSLAKGFPGGTKQSAPAGTLVKAKDANYHKEAHAKQAAEQAAKMVGANRTYVAAVTKAAGYDAKTQTFSKPEVLEKIGGDGSPYSQMECRTGGTQIGVPRVPLLISTSRMRAEAVLFGRALPSVGPIMPETLYATPLEDLHMTPFLGTPIKSV